MHVVVCDVTKIVLNCSSVKYSNYFLLHHLAVQNERQPRNTATIKPESLRDLDQNKVLREHSSLVGIFGYVI